MTKDGKRIFLLFILIMFLIWAVCPIVTGHKEPWDVNNEGYIILLSVICILPGIFLRNGWLLAPLGLYVGQQLILLYATIVLNGYFAPLSMILFTVAAAIPMLVGGLVGLAIRFIGQRIRKKSKNRKRGRK